MSSSKSLALLKLSLSPPTISLLHTLHTEFNTFLSQTSLQPQQTNQSTPKEILEGIFQVVAWDLKTQITHEEFSVLFTEWSRAKGSLLTSSRLFEMAQRNQFPIDQIVLALKNTVAETRDYHGFLAKTIELFSYEYDLFLYRTEDLGYDYQGVKVGPVDQDSTSLMNEIFKTFDQKEQGHLTLDGLFFLYIALQEKENIALIKDFDEEETFCTELNDRFKDFLTRIKCFQGRVTALQAKIYLLYNNISSKSELNSLRKSVRNTTEMALELNENILHEYGGLLPDLLQIAVKKAFPSLNLIEINKNPTDLQILYHFLLVRFYPYVHEQDYFEGLFISNKTLLSQMMSKEARKYYGDELFRTIHWSFDPTQAFLSVISAYNELVDQVLRFYFQFKGRESKEGLFTGRSTKGNYFQDTLNLSKDTINTTIQDYSQRQSRSMFTGRSNDNQISFRDPMEKEDTSSRYQVKMKGPPSLSINNSKKPVTVMRVMTRGVSETMRKDKENSHHYYKATQSSEKRSITPKRQEISLTKQKRDTSKENKRELFQVGTPTKKSVEVPVRNPQSIRKALDEVDTNYTKKMLPRQKSVDKLKRERSQEIEPLNKSENIVPKSTRREEDIQTVRLDSSVNKGNNQLNQIQEYQQKILSIAASKPPLKRQNSSKKVLIVDEGTYESFNPSYYEKSVQQIETEQERGEENITPELTRREPETAIADESLINDKSQIEATNRSSMTLDVSKMRAQNQQAWQQEKSILEQLTKRGTLNNGLEDKTRNSSFSGSQDFNKINISEIRKGSLASQQDQAIKSMRNHDIMDILAKLDTKISEGKQPGINKPNESFTSASSQSEQKMSLHARNSVEAATMNKSIMDIVKDHIEKEKLPGQTLRTRSDADEEPKKEFYLNLQEIINESKKEKSEHVPLTKPQEAKVFSMSIADHVRLAQSRKGSEKSLAKENIASPPTEVNTGKTLRESETLKSSIEKNKQIQELVGLKRNNSLTVKSRQNSSKSPANVKNTRVTKTESFEAVMERLKKGPGNTPTKGKSSKKAF